MPLLLQGLDAIQVPPEQTCPDVQAQSKQFPQFSPEAVLQTPLLLQGTQVAQSPGQAEQSSLPGPKSQVPEQQLVWPV